MSFGSSHVLRHVALALAAAVFVFVLLAIVSEAASDSDAATVTFDPGDGNLSVDGVDRTDQSSYYYKGETSWNRLTIPDYTVTDDDGHVYVYHKDGCYLAGWSRTEGGNVNYTIGNSQRFNNNTTVYAVWREYVITFDPGSGSVSPRNYTTTVSGSLIVPGNTFTSGSTTYTYSHTGDYVFLGWSTAEDDTAAQVREGDVLRPPTSNYTLYAIWKRNVTVTYLPNGGSADPGNYSFQTYENITVPGNRFTVGNTTYEYTNTGKTFLGWSTNTSSVQYVLGDVIETGNSNITLYAIWSNGCTIVFDPNEGGTALPSVYAPTMEGPLYVPKASFKVDGTTYTYSKEGHTFLGWADDKRSTSPNYVAGGILPYSETGYVLYAVWKIDTNNLTFVYGDGYTAQVEIAYGYTFDSAAYMNYIPQGKEGYKIVGWSTIAMSNTTDVAGAYSIPAGAETYSRKISLPSLDDLTLYPIWALEVEDPSGSTAVTFSSNHTGVYYLDRTASANGIVVDGGSPHLFLDNVYTDFGAESSSPFVLQNGANVTITVMSDCYFKGADEVSSGNYYVGYAGINVQTGTTLTISKDSLGKLTARGGSGTSEAGGWGSSDKYGRAGAGIGSNGRAATNSPYDDGCGTIIINGGTISAYGGDGYVDISGYNRNYDVVAAQGIGGTTAMATGVNYIIINGGTVTAATGHVNGKRNDGNNYVVDNANIKFTKPIYDGSSYNDPDASSHTYISDNARVTKVYKGEASINTDDSVMITFTSVRDDDGECTIGNALSVTIDDSVTIDIGGMSIERNVVIYVRSGEISAGSSVILVTKVGNYFTGTATASGNNFNVRLTESNSSPHGTVDVYANEVVVNGGENWGSISPHESFTVAGSGNSNTMVYPFVVSLNEGYECVGVEIGTMTNGILSWSSHELDPGAGESMTIVGGDFVYTLELQLSTSGAGTKNYISFTFQKIQVEVTINNTYSEGDDVSYPEWIVTPAVTDPSGITWSDATRRTGTQSVYYKDSMTYTVNVTRNEENPFMVKWVTANGESVTVTYDSDSNNGRYTFTVNDISAATVIEIRYVPTVKLAGYTTFENISGVNNDIKVQGILADGGDGFLLDDGTIQLDTGSRPTKETYVEKGTVAYFKIYSTGDWRVNNREVGIKSITVETGTTTKTLNRNIDNVYTAGVISADAVVHVVLTPIKWDLIFHSDLSSDPSQQSSYTVRVVDGTYYVVPTENSLEDHQLLNKVGYDIDKWLVEMYDSNDASANKIGEYRCDSGDTVEVTCKLVFTAEWSEIPHEYDIVYDVPDDATLVSPVETYNITTPTFTLCNATRPGYKFLGWITDGQDESQASTSIQIAQGSIGDKHYISVWQGVEVTFSLVDPKGFKTTVTQEFTIGSPFEDLPMYSNYKPTSGEYAGKKMTFAGWSLDSNGTQRITDTTLVQYHQNSADYVIYVIWVSSDLYIINVTNDGSYGGTVSVVGGIYGEPGVSFVLNIEAYAGYRAKTLTVNNNAPIELELVTNPGTYTYPTSAGVYFYQVTVEFEKIQGIPIPYPTVNNFVYDGTLKTAVSNGTGYTVEGNTGTDAGIYTARITLAYGYIWDDGTDGVYEVDWEISKRYAYIIALSETRMYTGTPWVIPNTSFAVLCVIPSDMAEGGDLTITSTEYSITAVGSYTNEVHVSGADNYEFTLIKGTYVIYRQDTSSITVELTQQSGSLSASLSLNASAPTDPGRAVSGVQTVGRRESI